MCQEFSLSDAMSEQKLTLSSRYLQYSQKKCDQMNNDYYI